MMQELTTILEKYTDSKAAALTGAVFIVVDSNGKTLYSHASGRRTLSIEENAPLKTDSMFWIASLSKLVTAITVMIAVEKGLTTLDTDVRQIVPDLADIDILEGFDEDRPRLRKCTSPITLRQLLSHSSGFAYDLQNKNLQGWSKYVGRTEHTFSGSMKGYLHPLIFEPGKGWIYGAGMDWAGRVVEVVSGQSLEEFMQENIFSKLAMHSTTFRPELRPDFSCRRVELSFRNPVTKELTLGRVPYANPAQDCTGGVGLYSTPSDCAALLRALLTSDHQRVLRSSSLEEIMTPQLQDNTPYADAVAGKSDINLWQTWAKGVSGMFGLSANITAEDFPGRRAKGSCSWMGMPGIHCWLDRKTGVAACFFTQILPPADSAVTSCLVELETALYKELRRA